MCTIYLSFAPSFLESEHAHQRLTKLTLQPCEALCEGHKQPA
jgi:hypothetical protein